MIVLDLPFPPSLNRIWAVGKAAGIYKNKRTMYKTPAYLKWQAEADGLLLTRPKPGHISGPFEAEVKLCRGCKGDLDNYGAKAVFDWCQSRGIIANDRDCQRLTMEWVDQSEAPEGCRVILHELVAWRPAA